MGKIFYLMGKSASGKDTVYKKILERFPDLETVTLYTTRPVRSGEQNGVEYYFTTEENLARLRGNGKIIESRTYQTVLGPWTYATVNDGQIDLDSHSYLMIGTLESCRRIREYFGERFLEPLYIEVEDGERLLRSIARERQQARPEFSEVCRRFLADEEDFSEEKLREAGIDRRYENSGMEECLLQISDAVKQGLKADFLY